MIQTPPDPDAQSEADPVLITGVGVRVGLALAVRFLGRGTPVIGTWRSERPGLAALRERGAELHQCDLDADDAVQSLIAAIRARHPRLRAIIHNASDWLADDDALEPSEIMRRMMQIHVSVPYQLNLSLAALLEATGHPHADIVHIGDYVSAHGSRKHAAYAASKAAQDNLTLSFAAKLGPRVKVNSIAPALILFRDEDDAHYRQRTLQKSVMHREGGLEEVQRTVDYLMDSTYVTGQVLALDGGRHLV